MTRVVKDKKLWLQARLDKPGSRNGLFTVPRLFNHGLPLLCWFNTTITGDLKSQDKYYTAKLHNKITGNLFQNQNIW